MKEDNPDFRVRKMKLGSMDPALACSGPMSTFSYDSHPISRGRYGGAVDELPRVYKTEVKTEEGYNLVDMDLEIQRVSRELYKAFNGLNEGFKEPKDQVVIDELSTHTDTNRQELIHPYKDNLGLSWEEACSTLMCEMRMFELECLRRRMEDEIVASQVAQDMLDNQSSLLSPLSPVSHVSTKSARSVKSVRSSGSKKRDGTIKEMSPPPMEREEQFTGISCLLITWKSNPEVEQFKELYLTELRKDHKKKGKFETVLSDVVSEQSLEKNYKVLGKGEGTERLLVKGKKEQLDEIDGDKYKYYLLAGTSHPYPDDTFYSVGRVPRKLLMKYLGIKMYLVRLRCAPAVMDREDWVQCRDQVDLAMACAGILSPRTRRREN